MGRYDRPRYGVMSEIILNKLYLGDRVIANDLQVLFAIKIGNTIIAKPSLTMKTGCGFWPIMRVKTDLAAFFYEGQE